MARDHLDQQEFKEPLQEAQHCGVSAKALQGLPFSPPSRRARGKAGPTWLSMSIDLQHEVGDQVKVKDALIVGLLGRTGQGAQGLSAQHRGTAKHPLQPANASLGQPAQDLEPGAWSGLHLEPALVTSAASFPAVQRESTVPSQCPDLCTSAEQHLTSNRTATRFLWTKLPHPPGSSNPSGSEQELL